MPLLVRHKHRHTNHHAAASLSFKIVPAPLDVAHDTNATRPTARATAPPCPSHTRHKAHARDGARGRGGVRGGLRISGRRRRVVVGEASGVFWNYPKYSNHPKTKRASLQRDQWLSKQFGVCWVFLERVWWPFFIAMRPPPGPVGAGMFLVWGVPVRPSASRLLINRVTTYVI